jgi:hypothetical protein
MQNNEILDIEPHDALGNLIMVGNWYGYSRSDGGHSHTTIGQAIKLKRSDFSSYNPAKVRLGNCTVKRFLYGTPSDFRVGEVPADITIASYMVFPVVGNTNG